MDELRYPWLWRGLGLGWIVLIVYLSVTPSPPQPPGVLAWDKAQHALAYAFLGWWLIQSWPGRWLAVALGLVLMGGGIELIQGLVPGRMMQWGDVLANTLGTAAGVALAASPLGRCLATIEALLIPDQP